MRRLPLAFLLMFAPTLSAAQPPRDALNPTGMVGGVFWSPMRLVGPSVDEQTRRKFQEDLLDLLRHHQKTVIFVTHSIEEAAYLSDQIALLSPRPGTVSRIVRPDVDRSKSPDEIRRDRNYLDSVDEIWKNLRQYV